MNKEKLVKILKSGLDCSQYIVLLLISQGENVSALGSKEVQDKVNGWRMILQKKGLLDGAFTMTEAGSKIISAIEDKDVIVFEKVGEVKPEAAFNLEAYSVELIKQLKAKLKEHINREQVEGFGGVMFIPVKREMMEFLTRFSKGYDVPLKENADKIEKILLRHLDKCARARKFAPAIKYYIVKDKTGSQLAAALESFEEMNEEKETEKKQFNIVNTKNLF